MEQSLVEFGKLTKPATTLIKKISGAVGTIYEPRRVRKVAEAEAYAARVRTESEIEIQDIRRRAELRREDALIREQQCIEGVVKQAIEHLDENSRPQDMNEDWIANLFDRCKLVSDREMQSLWSRILAGEASAPGTFSKKTVNIVADLERSDAELFTNLCGFGWMLGQVIPLIFDIQEKIYNSKGINFASMTHLENVGLVDFSNVSGFKKLELPNRFHAQYYGNPLMLDVSENNNEIPLGKVLLTKFGQQLAPICGSRPVDGFFEYVKERWAEYLPPEGC